MIKQEQFSPLLSPTMWKWDTYSLKLQRIQSVLEVAKKTRTQSSSVKVVL